MKPLAGVRVDLPFREQDGRGKNRRRRGHTLRGSRAGGELEIENLNRVRIGMLRQCDEIRRAILDRNDGGIVYRCGPERGAVRQFNSDMRVSTVLDEISCVREDFAFLGNSRRKRSPVDDQRKRFTLSERTERELQVEWTR